MEKKNSKILNPGNVYRSYKARKTRHPMDHLGRQVDLDRNVTPPFGRTNQDMSKFSGIVKYIESHTMGPLRNSNWDDPKFNKRQCPLCATGLPDQKEYNSFSELVQHIMEEHTDIHCNSTEFVCTDKMFQVSIEDKDYDELTTVQHGFFMSCEEAFKEISDLYFHYLDIHCLEDTCDICGKWLASRKGCLIDHYLLAHNQRNKDMSQCPVGCRENLKHFNGMLKHVIDKHVKLHHVCHVCISGGGPDKKEPNQEIKGVFKTRQEWLEHCKRAHPGVLIADMVIRGNKVNKSLLNEKISLLDCTICQKRGKDRSGWDGRAAGLPRCKTLQTAVDHIYEEHCGEGFICWGCNKIKKYTDVKHLRECLFQLSDYFELRHMRPDKKMWYAFAVRKKGQGHHGH